MIVKEKIFLLKKISFGESHLILHGLNEKGAKLSLMAKGAKRSRKRFSGGILEPTHYLEVVYRKPQRSDGLAFLQEAFLKESFSGLRTHYEKLELAFYFLRLVDVVSFQGMISSQEIFHLLGHGLRAAESTKNVPLLKVLFEMKFLYFQGVLPSELIRKEFLLCPLKAHGCLELSSFLGFRLEQEVSNYLERL